jgi:hypothetical protein
MARSSTTWRKGQSGNPTGRARKGQTLAEKLRRRVEQNGGAEELIAALWAAAVGHWVEETDRKGNERIYLRSPDIKAIGLIFERLEGKVPVKLEEEHRLPDQVVEVLRELAATTRG